MKKNLFLIGLIFSSFSFNSKSIAQYCTPDPGIDDCQYGDFIDNFTFGSINNLSSNCSLEGYSDFTNMSTNIVAGNSYTANVSVDYYSQGIGIWIDWNQDFDFEDAGEFYSNNNVTVGYNTENINILVPISATSGPYRMRVGCEYDNIMPSTGSCVSLETSVGEYEDYTLTVQGTNLHFDGTDDQVNLGTGITSALIGTNNLTVEAWINIPNTIGTKTIFSNHNGGGSTQLNLRVDNDRINAFIGFGTFDVNTNPGSISANTWTHVALVYDDISLKVYINGVLSGTTPVNPSYSIIPSSQNYLIGNSGYFAEIFTGNMDEIRVWNIAKTEDDIQRSKNCELMGTESNLLAYYKFNSGGINGNNTSYTTLINSSVTPLLDGTLNNFTLTGTTSNWTGGSVIETGLLSPVTPSASNQNFCGIAVVDDLTVTGNGGTFNWFTTTTISSPLNGTDTITTGTYYVAESNANGCYSSSLQIEVETFPTNFSTSSATNCGSFVWSQTGQTLTASGSYYDTLTNVFGCDSIIELVLTINALPSATATNNGDLTITAGSATSYQWINCATNTAIAGETQQTFTASVNGSYAVVVTNASGCSDTSSCVTINNVGIDEIHGIDVSVYPNPTNGIVTVEVPLTGAILKVFDIQGRVIWSGAIDNKHEISLINAEKGVYLLEFTFGKEKVIRRVTKN